MSRFSPRGLQIRLMLLIMVVAIPAIGIIVFNGEQQRHNVIATVQEDTTPIARMLATYQEQWVDRSKQIVTALTTISAVYTHDADRCNTIFAQLGTQYPNYPDLLALDANGMLFCSSAALPVNRDFSRSVWYRQALATNKFVASDVIASTATTAMIQPFAMPVMDATNTITAVVMAGLNLAVLSDFAEQAGLPEDSVVSIVDNNGYILAHTLDPDNWVGKHMPDEAVLLLHTMDEQPHNNTTSLMMFDEIPRLYVFMPIQGTTTDQRMYVSVGIPTRHALQYIEQFYVRNAWIAGIFTVVVMVFALLLVNIVILTPVRRLVYATKALALGDLDTRIDTTSSIHELVELSQSFNLMATALKKNQEQTKQAKMRYRMLVEQVPSIIYTIAIDTHAETTNTPDSISVDSFRLTYISPRIERLTGTAAAQWYEYTNPWHVCIHPDDYERVVSTIRQHAIAGTGYTLEYRLLCHAQHKEQTLDCCWVRDDAIVVYDENNNTQQIRCTIQGSLIDIQEQKEAEAIIEQQAAVMHELSTPLLRIGTMILLVPLVGSLNSHRVGQMMEIVLHGVEQHRAKMVILDITGVPVVDTQVAQAIMQTERAVRLIGAHMILTGIRPEVAQAIIGLGINLEHIVTHSTLQQGIAYALRHTT